MDYLLINHKFNDEFGFTKGPFHEDTKKENTIAPKPTVKKIVSEMPRRLKPKQKTSIVKASPAKKSSVPRNKSVNRSKPYRNLVPNKQFDFGKLPK